MITPDNYLSLSSILINEVVGDVWLAWVIGCVALVVFGVRSRVPTYGIMGLLIILSFAMVAYAYDALLLVVVLLFVGLIFYALLARMIKK